nr:MAG TPA: hypothetical protein [Caudoviricetes sp.]
MIGLTTQHFFPFFIHHLIVTILRFSDIVQSYSMDNTSIIYH